MTHFTFYIMEKDLSKLNLYLVVLEIAVTAVCLYGISLTDTLIYTHLHLCPLPFDLFVYSYPPLYLFVYSYPPFVPSVKLRSLHEYKKIASYTIN